MREIITLLIIVGIIFIPYFVGKIPPIRNLFDINYKDSTFGELILRWGVGLLMSLALITIMTLIILLFSVIWDLAGHITENI